MNLVQQFPDFIRENNLFQPQQRLLLAVSGGLDSVVLTELCRLSGFSFSIAHVNFGLRGEESVRDEQLVRALGKKYGVDVFVETCDTLAYAEAHKVSTQVAAREWRYAWFHELAKQMAEANPAAAPVVILTAHHLNDSLETLLMNFFKGTGVKGLQGIAAKQGNIARPLLFAWKEELKAFAEARELQWAEDSSNQQDKYTRNYFRNQVIPLVSRVFPAVERNLANNLERFADLYLLYGESIARHKKSLLQANGSEYRIPVLKLKKLPARKTILFELLSAFGFTPDQSAQALQLLDSETGRYVQSHTHRVIRNRQWLIITSAAGEQSGHVLVEENDLPITVSFPGGEIQAGKLAAAPAVIPASPSLALLDAKGIRFPLIIRRWKAGDYFYPLGMRKKKKLSRFFIDQKLSAVEKERVWVLEANQKIVWVIGQRIDDRFKLTASTKTILQLQFKSAGSKNPPAK